MSFFPNRKFRRKYRQLFKDNPLAANLFLLIGELSGPDGKIILPADQDEMEKELQILLSARFEDPREWQLRSHLCG